MEFLSRASSTSEVLTLNLTNLLILLVLKAVIFGFGIFAAGGTGTARSSDESFGVTEPEATGALCYTMYMAGYDHKLSCVQRSACQDSETADKYYDAAKPLYEFVKIMGFDATSRYESALNAVTMGSDHAKQGGDCAVFAW